MLVQPLAFLFEMIALTALSNRVPFNIDRHKTSARDSQEKITLLTALQIDRRGSVHVALLHVRLHAFLVVAQSIKG
jgi:hypothetical protein